MNNDVLVIGDYHAHPNYDNDRARLVSRFIEERQPDTILQIGDLADMPSLSSYDTGTKSYEGRRYSRDIESAREAQELLFSGIREVNKDRARKHDARYSPRKVITLGNHDDRIDRAINGDSKLEGTLNLVRDLGLQEWWDDIVPFKESIDVNGLLCSHYFATGVSGRPIAGESPANLLLKKNYVSSVVGHSHLLDIAYRTRADGSKMVGVVCGCFAHPKMIEGWNKDTVRMWWYGIIYLREVIDGSPTGIDIISMEELQEQYGRKGNKSSSEDHQIMG